MDVKKITRQEMVTAIYVVLTIISESFGLGYGSFQFRLEMCGGDVIATLNALAEILREKRMRAEAISFDKVEVKFLLDKNNNPLGVYVGVVVGLSFWISVMGAAVLRGLGAAQDGGGARLRQPLDLAASKASAIEPRISV